MSFRVYLNTELLIKARDNGEITIKLHNFGANLIIDENHQYSIFGVDREGRFDGTNCMISIENDIFEGNFPEALKPEWVKKITYHFHVFSDRRYGNYIYESASAEIVSVKDPVKVSSINFADMLEIVRLIKIGDITPDDPYDLPQVLSGSETIGLLWRSIWSQMRSIWRSIWHHLKRFARAWNSIGENMRNC